MSALDTIPFKTVLDGLFALDGGEASAGRDARQLGIAIAGIANRYATAHEFYRWPQFSRIEERAYRPYWAADTTYDITDELFFDDDRKYYRPDSAPNNPAMGESPATHPETWIEITQVRRVVLLEQDGECAIGAALAAWDRDPESDRCARRVDFTLRADGIYFAPDAPPTVWLDYREPAPDFHARVYDAAKAYAAGESIYWVPATGLGEVYDVLALTTAGQTPATNPAKFEKVDFPRFLSRAVQAGAYAEWLTGPGGDSEGQRANIFEAKFTDLLNEQVFQITNIQGQTRRARFRRH